MGRELSDGFSDLVSRQGIEVNGGVNVGFTDEIRTIIHGQD